MKKLTILIVLLFTGLFCYADYNGTVTTSQSELVFTSINGYDVVSFKKGFYTEQIGEPQLPVKILSFVIPVDKKVSDIIINSTSVEQLSGIYNVYPVQTPVPTNLEPDAFPFDDPNLAIYNSNEPYPGKLYEIIDDGYPMGYHVVTIKFYPVEYIPASKILNLYTNIKFTIVYENNTENILLPNRQSAYSNNLSKEYVKSIVVNPDDVDFVTGGARQVINYGSTSNIKGMNPTNLTFIPDYIIITSSDLINSFKPLSDWKTQKGVYTLIVDIQDIYSNYQGIDNAEKIRNYLKDVYVNFGSSYILLGGDVDIVPTRFTPISGIHETNFYYATVQRDWNADGDNIFGEGSDNTDYSKVFDVGRAPVNNQSQADNFVNKVIRYEKLDNTTNKNYVNNLSFWAGDNNGSANPFINLNEIDNSTSGYINPENYYVLKLYDKYQNHIGETTYSNRYFELSRNNVLNSLNTGWNFFGQTYGNIHLIYHCDHSGPDAMGTSTFDMHEHIYKYDMDNLTNGNYYQILYTDGCKPNQFSLDAISEHYINNQNGGGVAFIGNSDFGWWGDITDDNYFGNYFCQSLYDLTKPDAYNNHYYRLGFLNNYSATNDQQRLKNRNLLGDPEMMVWTDIPHNLTVTNLNYSPANKKITGTVSGLTFTATPHVIVTVCAWKGNEIYSTQDISATTPSIPFSFSNIMADTPGDIIVTVTAHNYIPNINTINVSSIAGAHPYMTSYTIDDSGPNGNNDQQPDAGETIYLPVTLTNSGNTTANNVTATLSWQPSPYQASDMIDIINNSSSFGNITAGGNASNSSSPYEFTINKDAFENITPRPLTLYANFKISIYINGVLFSEKTFDIQIAEPNIEKGENIVTDGTLAAGSTNQLEIKLYNKGLSQATGLKATLTTNNPSNITIVNGTNIPYNNLDGVNTSTNNGINTTPFIFEIGSNDYTNETFNLEVINQYGKTWTFNNFNLSVPIIANYTINHFGYSTSINLYWDIILSPSVTIKGYNLYRSLNQSGPYTRVNTNLINYRTYLDENLQPLTSYYYKLTVVDINGNESDFYPSDGYLASTSLNLHTGWPISPSPATNEMGNRAEGSPNVCDVDGDNKKEIFFTTGGGDVGGGVWAFKEDGSRWFMLDGNSTNISGIINLNCYTSATPSIEDIDGDEEYEFGITTHYTINSPYSQNLFLYKTTIDNNGDNLPDKVFNVPITGWEINKGSVFSDIDNDGHLEIIINNQGDGEWPQGNFYGGGIKIYNFDGTVHNGWENTSGYNCGYSMPVAFDFNDDSKKEIVIGCTNSTTHDAGIYIWKEDGTSYNQSNPVYTPASEFRTDFPPVVADLDNDGTYEIIFISAKNMYAYIYAMKPDGNFVSRWDPNGTHPSFTLSKSVMTSSTDYIYDGQFCPNIAVGDINKDGYLEVVSGDAGHLFVWNYRGFKISDIPIPNYTSGTNKVPLIADIDNDNSDLEIIVTNTVFIPAIATNIYAFKLNGQLVDGFPITISEEVGNTPCIDDIDYDGNNELIVTTPKKFYIWDTYGDADNNIHGWLSYRHDSMNTGIFKKECLFIDTPIEIDANETWDSYKKLKSSVIVKSGNNLTIKSKISFPDQAKIIIEPGAKLILDGGTLTNGCGTMWQGIEVWGNRDLPQYPESNQGVVELKNGATIENARCAITTCQKDAEGNILWDYTGGIIHAKDANFINNRKAIEFLSYHNILPNGREIDNSSYFNNCTFETNAQLSDPGTLPETFVSLYNVKGVKFLGCTFQNTAQTGVYSTIHRGNGITSIDASYEVKPLCLNPYIYPCSEYQPNTFQNLYYGIYASNTNPAITLTISVNNFDNNHRSIFLKSINNATITKNNFDIGASIGNINDQTYERKVCEAYEVFIPSYSYGVYLKECSGYKVEENNFSTTHDGHAGIIVDNSGTKANEIYNNTFDKLAIGTQAQGINAAGGVIISKSSNPEHIEINVGQGLQFLCNQYFNISSADIAVTSGRIAQNQGYCRDNNPTFPAGNKFSHTCNISTSDIHVNSDASKFNYSHHNDPDYIPRCYSSDKVTLHDCHIKYDPRTSCPSHLNSGLTPAVLKQIIKTNKLEIEKLISLIDNGETETLLAQIHQDEEPERIKNALESASPYLSDRVLLAAIKEKPKPLPPDILKEIIISNSPVTDTVMSALNTLKLPDDIQKQIQEVQKSTSARAELEQQISYMESQKGIAENDLMRQYLNDTTINGIDSIIAYLETQRDLINKKQLVQAYLVANQCKKAKILLGQLPQENDEDKNFYNFYNLLTDLCVSEKTYFELTSAQEQTVREIAESETSVSVNAQAILSLVYNEKFPEIIEELKFIIDLRNAPQQGEPLGDQITKQIQFVKIYPNPAENTITIELSAELDNKNISVEIYNYLGQKIIFYNFAGDLLNTLDVSDLSNGIYIFKILVGNKIIAREKVVIEK